MDQIELAIPGKMEFLPIATRAAREVCETLSRKKKINKDFTNSVELVVSEAATNVLKHVANGCNNVYLLLFEIFSDRLIITIRDHGSGFNLKEIPSPDLQSLKEGGYGLFVIQSKMDEVVCASSNKWSILSMTKLF